MTRRPLTDLEDRSAFERRHVGSTDADRAVMLATIGVDSVEELVDRVVPPSIRSDTALALPVAAPEATVLARLRAIAARNEVFTSLIGLGYADTVTPPVVQRNVLESPAWYTAYTPYQPEISQGRLEALLNFQTVIADLAGCDLANASMLDEATAAAEAMTMLRRLTKHTAAAFFVDGGCHPQTIAVVATRAEPLGIALVVGDPERDLDPAAVYGALLAYPTSSGAVADLAPLIARVHDAGGLVAVTADLLALVLLRSPGSMGADVVVGSAQRFGVPLGFGGPHAGFLACHESHARSLPGRLVGVSVDTEGRRALRLALQTREQHIRREKATSNICTAQVLLAVMAGFYAVWHGPDGLRTIAERVHRLTAILAEGLRRGGVEIVNDTFFDTLTISVPGRAASVHAAARDQRINLREIDGDTVGVSLDETSSRELVETLWAQVFDVEGSVAALDGVARDGFAPGARRRDEILGHDVFHRYHSEHEMLRYLRRLADCDLALDRTMIPLGSCTMKLNATAEMLPITWPELASIHPFAPLSQAGGYLLMIRELEAALCEITGYDAVSLQPNAGSQGELAGLLAIRAWHRSQAASASGGHPAVDATLTPERTVCLIPQSAHGTNAASAVMAGMHVVVVACDSDGNVDLADLEAKCVAAGDRLSCVMVTYPSTHGVFETGIVALCDTVHRHGGQVYLDGANLNAMVGLARPGRFGADVSHLNLHKTFCIPHGGGGPGVGPVAVRSHLAPFLPNHPLAPEAGPVTGIGPVSSAPWGSAGILAIPWMYLRLMGPDGLRRATEAALVSANYVARRLDSAYPVLYRGEHGLVAHECILDVRPITQDTGITAEDIAKRLIDFGFHAPTLSFPVAGTLMVEPTESESLVELDRFCGAMLTIREEIALVAAGRWPADDNPLRRAPHTAADATADEWTRPYPREVAVYPVDSVRGAAKYWPPVGRIDAAFGDRNLVCACPPMDAYAESHTGDDGA